MMKKILSILLVIGLLLVSADSFAQMNRFNVSQKILIATKSNDTGSAIATDITSASVLVAGAHRILGYTVTATSSGSTEIYGALYDLEAATTTTTDASLIAEAESRSSGDTVQVWFPYPREIGTGIIVRQGAYTCVTVYYEYYNGA
jgi:hypothetical protein